MEDDYIDYPAQAEVANVVPVGLTAKLRRSHSCSSATRWRTGTCGCS